MGNDLTYKNYPIKILDTSERVTRSKIIWMGKVQWSHHTEEEAVNTKNWCRKGTDLWVEFGNEMPFGRKNLLRGFGKDACGRQYAIVRQKDCLRF
jgi:hypothetical protein